MAGATLVRAAALAGLYGGPARALDIPGLGAYSLERQASGALAMLGVSLIPDSSASQLEFDSRFGQGSRSRFRAWQLSGGFTWSEDFPLYLEGAIGYDRYDPDLLVTDGAETGRLRSRWTGVGVTGGVGWDVRLAEGLWLRPIVNVSLGQVVTDAQVVAAWIADRLGRDEADFLRDGGLTAGGIGGALALVHNRLWESGVETDAILRYTRLHIEPIGGDRNILASARAETLALWSRLRVPTRITAFDRPVRAVYEFNASWLPGDQGEVLHTDWLAQIGAGLEIDPRATGLPFVSAARIVFRYARGEYLEGYGVGLAVSF